MTRLWWRLRTHGSLWVIEWDRRRGFAFRCALCGRAGIEVDLPAE